MGRPLVGMFLPLLAAAASFLNLVQFKLNRIMDPSPDVATSLAWYAAFPAIVVLAAAAMIVARSRMAMRGVLFVLVLVLIIVAGFVPRLVDLYVESEQQAVEQAEGADVEMEFQSAYLERSEDIDTRLAAKTPYTPDEALAFLEFAADSDLSWRGLPDHTPEVFAMVEQAIEGGILDPNALTTTAPTADSPAVTVTLAFYDKRIRPASPRAIKKHDWDVLEILVAHGADAGAPDAAGLRADLAKTVILGEGRFLELK